MDKLNLPQAKLLFCVAELFKGRKIDEAERTVLKGRVVVIQRESSAETNPY